MKPDKVQMLLVEDNPADVFLLEAALETSTVSIELSTARDGVAALEHLRGGAEHAALPDLVLLDLNMPRMNGFDVLAAVRAEPALAHLVVVVFTTSNAPADVKRAYTLRANSYVSKPASFEGFTQLIRQLEGFWFGAAELPHTYAS